MMAFETRSDGGRSAGAGAGDAAWRLPADAHIGRAHLRVADLDRARAFYQDLLGLTPVRVDGDTMVLAAGADPDAATDEAAANAAGAADAGAVVPRELLVLREVRGLRRRPSPPAFTGLYHVALLVPGRGALGRALTGLRAAGYPLSGMSDHGVSESIYLDDPDGNGLEIYADRPRASWPRQGGPDGTESIVMTVDPMDIRGVLAAADAPPARPRWTRGRGLPRETVVGHLHFTVSDLSTALAFYRDALGFDETMRVSTVVAVSAGGYHHHLNLNVWAGRGAPVDAPEVAGLDRWELVVPDASARLALARRVGAGMASAVSVSLGSVVSAHDRDGISVDIVGA